MKQSAALLYLIAALLAASCSSPSEPEKPLKPRPGVEHPTAPSDSVASTDSVTPPSTKAATIRLHYSAPSTVRPEFTARDTVKVTESTPDSLTVVLTVEGSTGFSIPSLADLETLDLTDY